MYQLLKAIKEYIKSEWLNLKNNHRLKLLSIIILVILYPLTISLAISSFILGILSYLLPGKKEYDKSTYKKVTERTYLSTIFDMGNSAEYHTWNILNSQPGHKKVLINLYIPNGDHTNEIDSILINKYGIFVIESKGYSGWIFGNENHKNWTQVLGHYKNRFYNPILQNEKHILALKKILNKEDNRIFRSYIVFSERCTLKSIKVFKSNVKVIQRHDLNDTLNKDYKLYGEVLNNEEIEKIYNKLFKYMYPDENTKKEHINYIQNFKNKSNVRVARRVQTRAYAT